MHMHQVEVGRWQGRGMSGKDHLPTALMQAISQHRLGRDGVLSPVVRGCIENAAYNANVHGWSKVRLISSGAAKVLCGPAHGCDVASEGTGLAVKAARVRASFSLVSIGVCDIFSPSGALFAVSELGFRGDQQQTPRLQSACTLACWGLHQHARSRG